MLFGIKAAAGFQAIFDPVPQAPSHLAGLAGSGLKSLTQHGKPRRRPRTRWLRRCRIRVETPGADAYNQPRAGGALSVSAIACPHAIPGARPRFPRRVKRETGAANRRFAVASWQLAVGSWQLRRTENCKLQTDGYAYACAAPATVSERGSATTPLSDVRLGRRRIKFSRARRPARVDG